MSFAILGVGTAVPSFGAPQAVAAQVAQVLCQRPEQASLVPVLYRQTEVRSRHMVINDAIFDDVLAGTRASGSVFLPSGADDDHGPTTQQRMQVYCREAVPLALTAARLALAEARLTADDITHLVTISCTGFSAPGVDIALMKLLGLAPTVQRTHIGFMGCHGALNGLRVAHALTGADATARVLLCAVELCSIHYHYGWDPKRIVANALFADGAAALVGTAATSADWRLTANGSYLFADSEAAMTWDVGNYGFEMTLSTKVPNLIQTHLRPWLEPWLGQHELRIADVASWAIHPGGPRILNTVSQALGIDTDATAVSREVLSECGNMSSPTVLFILQKLRQRAAPRPCVALAFGPGLVVEAALFG